MFLNLPLLAFRAHRGYSNVAAIPPAAMRPGLESAVLWVRVPPRDQALHPHGCWSGSRRVPGCAHQLLVNGAAKSGSQRLTSRISSRCREGDCGALRGDQDFAVCSGGDRASSWKPAVFLFCQSQERLTKAIPFSVGLVKFSPKVRNGVTNVFTGFKLITQ